MREIKFRAWDKDEKKLYHSGDNWHRNYLGHRVTGPIAITNRGIEFNVPAGDSSEYVDVHRKGKTDSFYSNWDYDSTYKDVELMQYTGLKDKNGKEIYEGDVLSTFMGMRVVSWDNENAKYIGFVGNSEGDDVDMDLYPVIVIGNVYENPELLTTNV